jgi:uncharacterized RmlC-like cupin family protein
MPSIAEFGPGGEHKLHRHPNCEQATFLLTGNGEHLTQSGSVPQEPGDAVYIAKDEWHGFRNTGSDIATLVTLHSVGTLAEAGYESFAGEIETKEKPRAQVVRLRDLQGDASLDRDSGFIGLGVFWLITRETVGANSILLGSHGTIDLEVRFQAASVVLVRFRARVLSLESPPAESHRPAGHISYP